MKINRQNYEIFFLDYKEGNLAAWQEQDLFLFLNENEDLKKEFENFELIKIRKEPEEFLSKDSLKRGEIASANVHYYLIAALEGDLKPEEKSKLEDFLKSNPKFRKDEKLFFLSKLAPDRSIIYENRNSLKQPIPITERKRNVAWYYAIPAAAMLALLIGVYFMNENETGITYDAKQVKENPKQESRKANDLISSGVEIKKNSEKEKAHPDEKIKKSVIKKQEKSGNSLKENNTEHDNKVQPEEMKQIEMQNTDSYAALVNPELIKEKLAIEIGNNPAAFDVQKFEAYLDLITDPDSSYSPEDLKKPVFDTVLKAEKETEKKETTPVLNALAWGLSKLSDDVKLRKNYNEQGELVAYNLEAGKIKIGKSAEK